MKPNTTRATVALLALSLTPGLSVGPAVAQECVQFSGESVRWKDPVLGICNSPALTATVKPRLRRGGTIRLSVVRHGIDQTNLIALEQQNPGVKAIEKGTDDGIGFLTVSIDLTSASLGDKILKFPHFTGGFTDTVQVVRRGEITGFAQRPTTAHWGDTVIFRMAGRDVGNAAVEIPGHATPWNFRNTNDSIYFWTEATATTAQTTAIASAWDKGFAKLVLRYLRPAGAPTITYVAQTGTSPCASVPGIGAPMLTSPSNGQVLTFPSPTTPVSASVTFTWTTVGDPLNRYILQVEMWTTTSKNPLNTTTDTVAVGTQATQASLTKNLTRNRQYKWKARAVNCGQSAPYSTVSAFTVK